MAEPRYVRINKTPFSNRWEVVREKDGVIIQRWPLHPDDAAALEAAYPQTGAVDEPR